MRVAIYERVSSEEQALHGYSLEAQDTALKDFAEKNHHSIVGVYCDEGISAHKPYTARPELLRLLSDCEKGLVDLIIFVKLDRWFRNVKEYYKVQEILDKNKVCWQAILEDYETITANGKFTVTIMLAIAQQEAERTSERIKFVFANKAQNGQPITGNYGFGYKTAIKDGVKTVVKDKEEVVNAMFEHFMITKNVAELADYMKETFGIETCSGTWSRRLQSERYTGKMHGIEGFAPAYITREEYEKILDIIGARRTRRSPNRTYLFSGLLVCPVCGGSVSGCTNLGKNAYYRCSKAWNKGGCTNKHSKQEKIIERFLLQNLKREAKIEMERVSELKEKPTKQLEEQLARLNEIYIMGNIDKDRYEKKTLEIKTKIAQIRADNERVKGNCESLEKVLAIDVQTAYEGLTREGKRIFWHSIIDKIIVDGDNIVFYFAK